MKKILVTGGLGYIGSHTVIKLIEANYQVVILDNLSNSKISVLDRLAEITGKRPKFVNGDIRDKLLLESLMKEYEFIAVIHFAGLKAVAESEKEPLNYFNNNVVGTLMLLESMQKAGIRKIVFSSSATVYGDPGTVCYKESTKLNPINVYGKTKLISEDLLRALGSSDPSWRVGILRYFNPVGCHSSGLIGEDPLGVPNNLMPFIAKVASGEKDFLYVFGNDYPTHDGTGLRDFIHVEDLANGHLKILDLLGKNNGIFTVNLGTGRPCSVLDLIKAFEKVSHKKIPYKFADRRKGDLAEYYADPSYAQLLLNWKTTFDINKMCQDALRWQLNSQKLKL
jgi:UDP-glucose 4-epimerase